MKEYVKANLGKTLAQPEDSFCPKSRSWISRASAAWSSSPCRASRSLTAANLHRSWLHVVHVTQHDEADITDLEGFRKSESEPAKQRNLHLTLLPFVMKAVVAMLKAFPTFNASLDAQGENLILKRYYHLGIAVDTEEGLLVPVIRDVDHKGVYDLAAELAKVSERARARKLMPGDMQGASFTISSLGGIGGTAFTPVVNVPEVAILGVSRASMQPIWSGGVFVPRLMLPLSLSYDHRVNDGALAARFTSYLSKCSRISNIVLMAEDAPSWLYRHNDFARTPMPSFTLPDTVSGIAVASLSWLTSPARRYLSATPAPTSSTSGRPWPTLAAFAATAMCLW